MEARKAQAGAEERVRRAREDEGRKKREREENMKRIVESEMKKLAEEEDLAKERKREEEKLRCSNVVCITYKNDKTYHLFELFLWSLFLPNSVE